MAAETTSASADLGDKEAAQRKYSAEYEQFSKELAELPANCEYSGRIKKLMMKLRELDSASYTDQLRRQFNDIDSLFAERARFDEFTSNADREWIEADFERDCRTAQREFDERVRELQDMLVERLERERKMLELERSSFDLVNDGGEQKTMCTRNLRKRNETTAFSTRGSRASGFEDAHTHSITNVTSAAPTGIFATVLDFCTVYPTSSNNDRPTTSRLSSAMPAGAINALTEAILLEKRPRRMSPTQLNFLLSDSEIRTDLVHLRNTLMRDPAGRGSGASQRLSNAASRKAVSARQSVAVGSSRGSLSSPYRSTTYNNEPYRFNVLPHQAICEDGVLLYDGRRFKRGHPISLDFREDSDQYRDSVTFRRRVAAFIKSVLPNEIYVKRSMGDRTLIRISLHDLAAGRVVLNRRG